jgi:endonuclease YncB( thermonuclease family)
LVTDNLAMANNVYKFRKVKRADPDRLKMIGPFERKRPPSRYFSGLVVLCIAIGFVAAQAWPKWFDGLATSAPPLAEAFTPAWVRVIDGDTISLDDGRPNVRLVGFNTPETGNRALCEAERQKGEAAKRRLAELVGRGRLRFQEVACSCPPGSTTCNYGRRCATLMADGKDVGSVLITEGLAVRFVCGATHCPPLPRPWC